MSRCGFLLAAHIVRQAASVAGVATAALLPPRLLSCEYDFNWLSYGATLDSLSRQVHPDPLPGPEGLPRVCTAKDSDLYTWSDFMLSSSWPQAEAMDVYQDFHYQCNVDEGDDIHAAACKGESEVLPCLYGSVVAAACMAEMFLRHASSMVDCCLQSALGAAKGLWWLLRSGEKGLEFLDSSSWPYSLSDLATLVEAYQPALQLVGGKPDGLADVMKETSLRPSLPRPWDPKSESWARAQAAVDETLARVSRWTWPPPAVAASGGGYVSSRAKGGPLVVRMYAFGTHCSVMAEPVSAVVKLLPIEFDLRVTWRGLQDYCDYLPGEGPLVMVPDQDSPVRRVYKAFHHAEDVSVNFVHSTHRDSLRTAFLFEDEFKAALQAEGPSFGTADLAFCTEPAIACLAMHEAGKPVLGYFGVHIAFLVKGAEEQLSLYRRFRDDLGQDPRSTLATVAPYISLQIHYHVPLELPAVRPVSMYTSPAVRTGSSSVEVLVNKRPLAFWDLTTMLQVFCSRNELSLEFVDAEELHRFGRGSFKDWASLLAGVYFPYDWLQTMTLYDWLNMGLPTFVPDLPMYTFSRGTNTKSDWDVTVWSVPASVYPYHYGDWFDLSSRVYWWMLTDFKILPGIHTYSSVTELITHLGERDYLDTLSARAQEGQLQRAALAGRFWRDALLRAMAPAR